MHDLPNVGFRSASFTHDAAPEPLFSQLTVSFPAGFTGIVGANGSGKTTLLRILAGELTLTNGHCDRTDSAVYCEQRTDHPPKTLDDFLNDWDAGTSALKSRLDVGYDTLERWESLSHGERKRAQIAHALWQNPRLLAIDEPTNHIDSRARQLLINALQDFTGVGVIVSHDRELLDALCSQCIWIDPPAAQTYQGGITQTQQQRAVDSASAERHREQLLAEQKKLRKAANARREKAAREHDVRSKSGIARKDSDARDKINRARVSDGNGGSAYRQLAGRSNQLQAEVDASRTQKTYTSGIWLGGTPSSRDAILRVPAGQADLNERCSMRWPDTLIRPTDRIALTGDNGAGKSSWLRHILPMINAPADKIVYIPQEMTAEEAREVHKICQSLSNEALGHVMTIVSRLNSRPQRLLSTQQPSPGEARKLALALGLLKHPHIVILDEPTNHLDLPSVESLQSALAECPCALLMISHDPQFIEGVGATTWTITANENGESVLIC